MWADEAIFYLHQYRKLHSEISMEDYVNSLEDFNDIRKVDNQNYPQSVTELKLYLKITKKITCLAQSTNTDHCYMGLDMVQKSNMATISDLRQINIILNKVRESKVSFSKIVSRWNCKLSE